MLTESQLLLRRGCRTEQVLPLNHETEFLEAQPKPQRPHSQHKAFLREVDAMVRLRSPYTVNVFGAITSLPDRLIIVMELLAGGDLRTLLKKSGHSLPEKQARQIIGDVCAGMAFLHGKETVHGDLKSANVLLDSAGRAKVSMGRRCQLRLSFFSERRECWYLFRRKEVAYGLALCMAGKTYPRWFGLHAHIEILAFEGQRCL